MGREYPEVHRLKDMPYLILGARHRVLLHDLNTALLIGVLMGRGAALSSLLHDVADKFLEEDGKIKRSARIAQRDYTRGGGSRTR